MQIQVVSKSNNVPSSKIKLSRSMIWLFIIMQLFFGINLGFDKHFNKIQKAFKSMSYLSSVIAIGVLTGPLFGSSAGAWWFFLSLAQYILNFIVLTFTKFNVYDFIVSVNDSPVFKEEKFGCIAIAYTVSIFLTKYCLAWLHCIATSENWCIERYGVPYLVYGPASLSPDVVSVVFILIYYIVYCSTKNIRQITEIPSASPKVIQVCYLKLTDCYDSIILLYDKLLTIELLFEVPRMMAMVYQFMKLTKQKARWTGYVVEIVYTLHIVARLFIPCLIIEMVNSQIDAIKASLQYRLLAGEDQEDNNAITKLLNYMNVRHLNHKLWRIIPVDMHLLLTILNVCITYLIVVIQFTHLY